MISEAISILYPNAIFFVDYEAHDDGAGEYITKWNRPEPEPTPTELQVAYDVWLAGALDRAKAAAKIEVNQQASTNYEAWQSAYASHGDWLAILQAVETSLRATRRDALDAIEAATTVEAIETVLAGLTWPPVPDQAAIEADVGDSLTAKQEARQFLQDNPNARLLLSLPPAELETAIETRTAGGETLLLKTLAFAVRYLNELIR